MSIRPLLAALLLSPAACVQEATVPKLGGTEIEMKIRQSTAQLAAGGTDTITVTVINHLQQQVRILFAVDTPCQILVFVKDFTARTVVPERGQFTCVPVASQMVIAADSSVDRVFFWKGNTMFDPPGSTTRLAPGDYALSATLNANGFSVPAFAIRVTVLP
jgi:hypothetical protein